jgi:2-keto-4-pentenoate hydratase/2-oxohepta-3-ene-1,7-dioic acid hydratase in catechol pathway
MKLFTYKSGEDIKTGVVFNNSIHGVDINTLHLSRTGKESETLRTMQNIIDAGEYALNELRDDLAFGLENIDNLDLLSLDQIEYLPPLPNLRKLRCFSVYEKHMTQSLNAFVSAKLGKLGLFLNKIFGFAKIPKIFYQKPIYYKGNHTAINSHKSHVNWPTFDEPMLDYELELGVVIGKSGKDIPVSEAKNYIWGYTVFNDFSARKILIEEILKGPSGPLKGKDFDGSNSFGPWIVTADEIENPQNLAMKVSVNNVLQGSANTSEMHWSIEECISEASKGETLVVGELISTGAAGNGTGIERWEFLKVGDEVVLEIEGIGYLSNKINK